MNPSTDQDWVDCLTSNLLKGTDGSSNSNSNSSSSQQGGGGLDNFVKFLKNMVSKCTRRKLAKNASRVPINPFACEVYNQNRAREHNQSQPIENIPALALYEITKNLDEFSKIALGAACGLFNNAMKSEELMPKGLDYRQAFAKLVDNVTDDAVLILRRWLPDIPRPEYLNHADDDEMIAWTRELEDKWEIKIAFMKSDISYKLQCYDKAGKPKAYDGHMFVYKADAYMSYLLQCGMLKFFPTHTVMHDRPDKHFKSLMHALNTNSSSKCIDALASFFESKLFPGQPSAPVPPPLPPALPEEGVWLHDQVDNEAMAWMRSRPTLDDFDYVYMLMLQLKFARDGREIRRLNNKIILHTKQKLLIRPDVPSFELMTKMHNTINEMIAVHGIELVTFVDEAWGEYISHWYKSTSNSGVEGGGLRGLKGARRMVVLKSDVKQYGKDGAKRWRVYVDARGKQYVRMGGNRVHLEGLVGKYLKA